MQVVYKQVYKTIQVSEEHKMFLKCVSLTNGLGIADVETVGYGSVEPLFDSSSSSSSSHPDCKLTRSSKPVYGVAGVFSSVDEIEGRGRSNESI